MTRKHWFNTWTLLFPLLTVWLLGGLASLVPLVSSAHGGGTPQLTNEPVGPYLLSAWTSPDPAVIGELHITVALALAETGEAVTEPTVQVVAFPQDHPGNVSQAEATHEGALTPYFYEADLAFSHTGFWWIQVEVVGEEGGGEVAFLLDVQERGLNWLVIGIIGSLAVVVIWMGWMFLRSPHEERP